MRNLARTARAATARQISEQGLSVPFHPFPNLFVFRNRINFVTAPMQISEKLLATEGEEWIRKAARAAAVPDTLHGLRTSAASPRAWRLSV
jgi:hypothetical protein